MSDELCTRTRELMLKEIINLTYTASRKGSTHTSIYSQGPVVSTSSSERFPPDEHPGEGTHLQTTWISVLVSLEITSLSDGPMTSKLDLTSDGTQAERELYFKMSFGTTRKMTGGTQEHDDGEKEIITCWKSLHGCERQGRDWKEEKHPAS
ncbi:hypothetical protein OPQ81_008056 [Rhizoctonia solani]|nr:hypothetical protein OPQ81_008056 [Rhizoctonia solani]